MAGSLCLTVAACCCLLLASSVGKERKIQGPFKASNVKDADERTKQAIIGLVGTKDPTTAADINLGQVCGAGVVLCHAVVCCWVFSSPRLHRFHSISSTGAQLSLFCTVLGRGTGFALFHTPCA